MTDSKHPFDGSHYEELARHVRSLGDAERAAASAAARTGSNENATTDNAPTVTELWLASAAHVDLLPRSTHFVPLVMDDDDRALHKSLLAIACARMELDARQLDLLRRAADCELHRKHGYAHMVQYMEEALGYRPHTAYEFLRVTKAIEELPLSMDALSSRNVHYTKVRELSRVATSETESEWLDAARSLTVRELEKLVSGRIPASQPPRMTWTRSRARTPKCRRSSQRIVRTSPLATRTYATRTIARSSPRSLRPARRCQTSSMTTTMRPARCAAPKVSSPTWDLAKWRAAALSRSHARPRHRQVRSRRALSMTPTALWTSHVGRRRAPRSEINDPCQSLRTSRNVGTRRSLILIGSLTPPVNIAQKFSAGSRRVQSSSSSVTDQYLHSRASRAARRSVSTATSDRAKQLGQ